MTVVTDKITNVIIDFGDNYRYDENGNIINITTNTGYFKENVSIYSDVSMPNGIMINEYMYTTQEGFKPYKQDSVTAFTQVVQNIESLQSNVDYLLLLNDPDSAAEESVQ